MKTMEIVEKSMGKGKVQSPHIFKRASTYFFHDFPINKKDKLGTRWTKKLSIYAGYTLRTSRERPIALCLLSGRPPVQLRPGTPVSGVIFDSLWNCSRSFLLLQSRKPQKIYSSISSGGLFSIRCDSIGPSVVGLIQSRRLEL